jgi:hypothetical protein
MGPAEAVVAKMRMARAVEMNLIRNFMVERLQYVSMWRSLSRVSGGVYVG